jgi:hypothetical protein
VPGESFICHECLEFLFSTDGLEKHRQETGHKTVAKIIIDDVVDAGDKRIVLFELSDENAKLQH